MSDREKTRKLARILQAFSSSDDRLDKALSVLDGSVQPSALVSLLMHKQGSLHNFLANAAKSHRRQ